MTDEEGFSRRDLLKAGTLAAILGGGGYGLWQGLDGNDTEQPDPSDQEETEQSTLLVDVRREIRKVLQTSLTHLPARARQLVDEEDAEGAYALVKEDVVTVPGGMDDMGEIGRVVWWARGPHFGPGVEQSVSRPNYWPHCTRR